MASLGVIDLQPGTHLVDLDPDLVLLVVVPAEPVVEALGILELVDLVGVDLDGRHQPACLLAIARSRPQHPGHVNLRLRL